MTQNTLTDEYEVFKLLKCSSELHQFYTSVNTAISQVGNRTWPFRVKFPEQLLDCVGKTIYIVEVLEITTMSLRAREDITIEIYVIEDMHVFKGKSGILDITKRENVTFEELASITTNSWGSEYLISSGESKYVFQLYFLNLARSTAPWCTTYDAVFYDGETAHQYAKELRDSKRKGISLN